MPFYRRIFLRPLEIEICNKSYDYAKRLAFPTAVSILEEAEELFGKNPWVHGLTPENQGVLEKFL